MEPNTKEISNFDEFVITTSSPEKVLTVEKINNKLLRINLDTTCLPKYYKGNFYISFNSAEPDILVFPKKISWKLQDNAQKKPRLSIRLYKMQDKKYYRKFICDLEYTSPDNTVEINNIERNTASVVIRFNYEHNVNRKYSILLEMN